MARKPYPSDVSDNAWAFVAPYLTRMREHAPQREYPLRELFNGLRWIVCTGSRWRHLPHDFPPWRAVYRQSRRWMRPHLFLQIADDPRQLLQELGGREPEPTAAILDSRTLRSTPTRKAAAAEPATTDTNASTAASPTPPARPSATCWR